MARVKIYNAARETKGFLHETGLAEVDGNSTSKITMTAKILSGPFKGETATTEWIGEFTLPYHDWLLVEIRESVGGERHFSVKLDQIVRVEDFLAYGFADPLTIRGNRFDNVMEGDLTPDKLFGSWGDDKLSGESGRDKLSGGAGRDLLDGGPDRDRLSGGSGADVFRLNDGDSDGASGRDLITDFRSGLDQIDLSRIASDYDFAFIAAAEFSGTAGEVRFENGLLSGDADGDADADFQIRIDDSAEVVADDLVL